MKPETIVQNQLEAYNARDLDKFLSCFAPDIELFNFKEQTPFVQGMEKLRSVYKEVFDSSPKLHATLDNRMVFGDKIIDYEKVTGRKGIDFLEVIVIYEVANLLINRVTYIRKEA